MRCRPVLLALLALMLFPSAAVAKTVTVPLRSLPRVGTAQAVRLLNHQRVESGIPASLALEPRLSKGCRERVTTYEERPGQYPHTEIEGQPGYTALGAEAASRSDLYLGAGAGQWTAIAGPWRQAPLHLLNLFDPASTEAWYGEAPNRPGVLGGACMGTGGEARMFSAPTFFSVPGGGDPSVPPAETSAEIPFTPAEAAGLPAGATTGPTVLLYAEGVSAVPQSARLTGPGGRVVPTRLITAESPAPPIKNFPWGPTVGGNYVVIPHPLKSRSAYELEVDWASEGRTYVQHSDFSTLSKTAAERRTAWGISCVHMGTCAAGSLRVSLGGNFARVSGGPAKDQPLSIEILRGRRSCLVHARPCPREDTRFDYDVRRTRRVRFDGNVRVHLPRPTGFGSAVEVRVQLSGFTARGYAWSETDATIFGR